ncbi:hypothetical protein C8R47DRAFT_1119659 [Mycena vitilis]|nr:hypothetical protein C8R47DRAFT_1119659 [Mycena vitilis]
MCLLMGFSSSSLLLFAVIETFSALLLFFPLRSFLLWPHATCAYSLGEHAFLCTPFVCLFFRFVSWLLHVLTSTLTVIS